MKPPTRSIKKIAIYEPSSSHVNVYRAFSFPRLGGILLATILKNAGYDATVYSEEVGPVDPADLMDADLVGVSIITPTAVRGYAMADRLRSAGIPVVMGGIHPTFSPDEGLEHADYVVRGEGEETILELLGAIRDGGDLSRIDGLSYTNEGVAAHNPDRGFLQDLDALAFPDYSRLSERMKFAMVSVMTSRGCPHTCSFCSVPAYLGRGYRAMSVERVLAEIRHQQAYHGKIRYLFFADDIFNLDKNRSKAILEGMLRLRHKPQWGAQVRHEASRDPELLKLMRKANCDRVFVGFESINPDTLKLFNKHESVEQIEQAVRKFHEHKVKVHGMFVVGSDMDSLETIHETRRLVRKWGIDTVQFLILTPIPGSKDFEQYQLRNRITSRDWSMYDGHHVVYTPEGMTPFELEHGAMAAMRRFYSVSSVLQKVFRRDPEEALVILSARKLVNTWFKANRDRLKSLKEDVTGWVEPITGLKAKGASLRRVAIARTADHSFVNYIETFFKELDVKIETMRMEIQDLYKAGSTKMIDGKTHSLCAIGNWLKTLAGKVDYLVVPLAEATGNTAGTWRDEVEKLSARLRRELNVSLPLIPLQADWSASQLRHWLMACALTFTDDIRAIQRAFDAAAAAMA